MKNNVLIINNSDCNYRQIFGDEFGYNEEYDVEVAEEFIKENKEKISSIIIDVDKIDPYRVVLMLQNMDMEDLIPMVICGENIDENIFDIFADCYIGDYFQKPVNAAIFRNKINKMIGSYEKYIALEKKVNTQTKQLKIQYDILQNQAKQLKENNIRIIDILGNVVEARSLENGMHIRHVKEFTRALGYQVMKDYPDFGLNKAKVDMIAEASALHDIGKIAIPDSILLKPGKLTDDEFEFMKSHTTRGSDILDEIEDLWEEEYRKVSHQICRYHHERYDGGGYPDKLKGEEIPIAAQIVSIVDVYDALISDRVYKSAYSLSDAFHMIIKGDCGVFSPRILESFRGAKEELEKIFTSMSNNN